MGGTQSQPAQLAPGVQVDTTDIATLLSGQSAMQKLAAAAIAQQQAPPPPPPPAATSSRLKYWLMGAAVLAALIGVIYGLYVGTTDHVINVDILDRIFGVTPQSFTNAGAAIEELNTKKQKQKKEHMTPNIPLSFNAPSGIEFTYTWWTVVDDWSYKLGKPKSLWLKGDLSQGQQCPGVYLGASDNSMAITFNTFKGDDTITVYNLPAQKWFHTAIVVHDENIVDVYINGRLKKSHKLLGIVKQNTSGVQTGVDGGFSGQLAKLKYSNYAYDEVQVKEAMAVPPDNTPPQASSSGPYAKPPYFSSSWWSGA
jgi:hypothetical protein